MRKRVCVIAAMASLAAASPSLAANSIDQIKAANLKLSAVTVDADARMAPPPRLANAAEANLIHTAFDADSLDGMADLSVSDAGDLCSMATKAEFGYVLYGLKRAGIDKSTPQTEVAQKLAALENANFIAYQDELGLAMRFNTACTAKSLPALQDFVAKLSSQEFTDVRKQGLAQVRAGYVQLLMGIIITQADPIRQANRDIVLDEGLRWADAYAASTEPASRAKIVATIDKIVTDPRVAPPSRAKLGRLRLAFQRTDCTGLCAFNPA